MPTLVSEQCIAKDNLYNFMNSPLQFHSTINVSLHSIKYLMTISYKVTLISDTANENINNEKGIDVR